MGCRSKDTMNYAQRTARDLTDAIYRLFGEPMEPTRRKAMIEELSLEAIERVIADVAHIDKLLKEVK